jgi:hypothetical protein
MPVAQSPGAIAVRQVPHSVAGTVRCLRPRDAGDNDNGRGPERHAGWTPLNDDFRVVLVKAEYLPSAISGFA